MAKYRCKIKQFYPAQKVVFFSCQKLPFNLLCLQIAIVLCNRFGVMLLARRYVGSSGYGCSFGSPFIYPSQMSGLMNQSFSH